ncbi:MAG TPA: ABC transporter permease, partial [Gemmatimonadaceae bacterium]|nr:ABC transporter permease [Gemmatimonadaceae bacterium]
MLDTVRRDLSFTARTLRRTPTFSITVAAILALGIGMSSAMFTVYRAVLLERMPVLKQDRLVELSGVATGAASEVPILPDELRRFQKQTRTLTGAAGFAHWRAFEDAVFDGDRQLTLREAVVTDGFFNVLGAKPVLGRLFHSGDAVPWAVNQTGAGASVVLSYATWQRDFGGDASVIGKHLRVPKLTWTMTVIGVAPPGLDYPRGAEYWIAADYNGVDVVGRLAPTATPAAARAEFEDFLAHDLSARDMAALGQAKIDAQVHTFTDMVSGTARPALVALTAAVALLLVLACANVGNLLLLRAAGRVREMAIRRAIGASAADLVRQLLTESVLLALAGGVLGALLGRALLDGLVRMAPGGLPRLDVIALAGTPVITVALVTGATVLLFGIVPALAAVRFDLSSPLRSDTRSGTEGRRLRKVRQTLVASQIALAVVVLAGAGLLLKSLEHLTTLDMGYPTEHLLMLNFSLPWEKYVQDCKPQGGARTAADSSAWERCLDATNYAAHGRVISNVEAIGGVVAVSPEVVPPFLGSNVWMGRFAAQHQSAAESKANPWFGLDAVGPEFFRAMGVPVIQGRSFTDADRENAPKVAIITEGVAHRLWPNESAIGKQLRQGENRAPDSLITVVGVVPDFHYRLHREATPTIFRPYWQL